MNKRAISRLLAATALTFLPLSAFAVGAPQDGSAKNDKSAAAGAPQQPAQQVRFEITISRLESGDPAGSAAVPPAASPATAPLVLGTPTLTTVDRNTASLSITGSDTSYNVSLSPTVETANNSVQVLWNVRLTGKNLGGGATAVAASGATRMMVGKDGGLAEISVTDVQTGKRTTFLIKAKVSLGDASSVAASPKP